MSEKMTPIPYERLLERVCHEYEAYGTVFGVSRLWKAGPKKLPIFGQTVETPFGPAAGPNTQLAQNIVAAYAAGARFFELKTVQTLDGEDLAKCISRPCINAANEGYNCEWSTELTVAQAMDEYVKAWNILKVISKKYGFGDPDGFVFNMNIKKHIPNAITSLNLVSGCIAIILTFNFDLKYAAYFILLAAVFDFFDGMAARWLHVKSAIGKELDSLADIVSFGVAPGLIVFQLCAVSNDIVLFAGEINLVPFIALLIPVFSALRLAKFNLDTRQTESFIGLPVPANALMIASLPLILNQIDQGVNQNDSLLGIVITSTCQTERKKQKHQLCRAGYHSAYRTF